MLPALRNHASAGDSFAPDAIVCAGGAVATASRPLRQPVAPRIETPPFTRKEHSAYWGLVVMKKAISLASG
jgi:hypothetical protein